MLLKKHNSPALTDTKTRIMHAAFELFGRYGFAGTSVRQIAQASGVNLAAVNYHFKNKENLFWEIMLVMFSEVDKQVASMAKTASSTSVLAEQLYDFFVEENTAAKNTMKMMMTEDFTPPFAADDESALKDPMGPPGGQHLADMIQRDIDFPLSREGALWGVRSIFGAVFHWALLVKTERVCDHAAGGDPLMSDVQIKKDVMRMVDATLLYIREQHQSFIAR